MESELLPPPSEIESVYPARPWEEIVAQKRAIREEAMQKYHPSKDKNGQPPWPSQEDRAITSIAELELLQRKISEGQLTAEAVITAYIRRAIITHSIANVITEPLFDQAIEEAQKLDAYFASTGQTIGPLHGIPITLKDQFNVKGVDTTLGYVGRAFKPAKDDAALVRILTGLGAVVFAKTNLPQSIMWNETENPLWGLTSNPNDLSFTPGGSTGGEAVLLACHGSLVGWGTDIGGSIRVPAANQGVYGLRPSSGRLPCLGVPGSIEGQEHVHSVIGPMARTLGTLTAIMKLVIEAQPWRLDPRCLPIPWREDQYQEVQLRPLVVGLLLDDGFVKVHPPIERALKAVETMLITAGHEVVYWDASGHQNLIEITDLYYSADGGKDIKQDVTAGGEPVMPHVTQFINRGKAISVYEYWQLNKRKVAAQTAYLDKWNTTRGPISGREVDVLLTPVAPHTAVPHRKSRWVGYCRVWNILDYTALAFPVSTVSKALDPFPDAPYHPRNNQDTWNWGVYDPEIMDGHPVGLQIVGRKLEEEKVLGVAAVFAKLFRS